MNGLKSGYYPTISSLFSSNYVPTLFGPKFAKFLKAIFQNLKLKHSLIFQN